MGAFDCLPDSCCSIADRKWGTEDQLKTTHSLLEDEVAMFQTTILQRIDEKSKKIVALENTLETIF